MFGGLSLGEALFKLRPSFGLNWRLYCFGRCKLEMTLIIRWDEATARLSPIQDTSETPATGNHYLVTACHQMLREILSKCLFTTTVASLSHNK